MKTASLTYPTYHYIDIAPLAARYELLTNSIMTLMDAGRMKTVLKLSHKVVQVVKAHAKFDTHNILLTRKLDMLTDKPWRERVLKELGGVRKLGLWEAARDRVMARVEERRGKAVEVKSVSKQEPAWLYTPERIAESERLKAHVRQCGRAAAHPNILRDRCQMDFNGMFRLAPLPRGPQAHRQLHVYTAQTITEYDFNPMPFAKVEGLGTAMVWPDEFYAAALAEADAGVESEATALHSPRRRSGPITDSGDCGQAWEMNPVLQRDERKEQAAPKPSGNRKERRKQKARDAKRATSPAPKPARVVKETIVKPPTKYWDGIPVLSLKEVMPSKHYERILGGLTA